MLFSGVKGQCMLSSKKKIDFSNQTSFGSKLSSVYCHQVLDRYPLKMWRKMNLLTHNLQRQRGFSTFKIDLF